MPDPKTTEYLINPILSGMSQKVKMAIDVVPTKKNSTIERVHLNESPHHK